MTESQPSTKALNPLEMSTLFEDIAFSSSRLTARLIENQLTGQGQDIFNDELGINKVFWQSSFKLASNPFYLAERQLQLLTDSWALWQTTAARFFGGSPEPVAAPEQGDRRFNDDIWEDDCFFDWLKQTYLLNARWLHATLAGLESIDEKSASKVDFYTRQFVDALSPTNFALTNPEVLREIVSTGGQNLVKGLRNMLADMERGKGQLNIRMTDLEAFRLGENIAVTPGKVIFQNTI